MSRSADHDEKKVTKNMLFIKCPIYYRFGAFNHYTQDAQVRPRIPIGTMLYAVIHAPFPYVQEMVRIFYSYWLCDIEQLWWINVLGYEIKLLALSPKNMFNTN